MKRNPRLRLLLAFAATFLAAGAASTVALSAERALDDGGLDTLLEEAAGDLLLLADELCREGYFLQASRALDASLAVVADSPGSGAVREALRARNAAMPKPAAPLDTQLLARSLFNGQNLGGWRTIKGKWEAERGNIECDAENSDALISATKLDEDCHGFTFTFSFQSDPGARVGVFLGMSGRSRVGVVFDESGAALFDFKEREALGTFSGRPIGGRRSVSVTATVRGGRVSVLVTGRPFLEETIEDWEPGDIGFYASGRVQFRNPTLAPIESDACVERAREALKKRDAAGAASFLLRARLTGDDVPAADGLLAEAMDDLGFRDEAAGRARAFLSRLGEERPARSELSRLKRAASAIAARSDEARGRVDARLAHWAGMVLEAGEAALAGSGAGVDEAASALAGLETRGDVVADLRSRAFLARFGSLEGQHLFNGNDLDGWTAGGGVWEVVEDPDGGAAGLPGAGVLAVTAPDTANALESVPLPAFDRFLLKTDHKGTGSYIDQGIRFHVGGEAWSLNLFRFMDRQEITVNRGSTCVYFCHIPENALTSTRWHDVDCLVHMNRITVIFDGQALFTKVLPAPPEPRIALITGGEHRGHFRNIVFRPLGKTGEYEKLLTRLGVPVREVFECESVKERTSAVKGQVREQPFAYNGFSLAGALDPKSAEGLAFRFKTLAFDDAVLSVRYAAAASRRGGAGPAGAEGTADAERAAAELTVIVDGREPGVPLDLKATASANDFSYARAPLGSLDWGWHEIRLRTRAADGQIVLDRLVLSAAKDAPEEETRIRDSAAALHFKIRLSPGVRLPDNSEEVFALLEVLRGYMVAEYGYEPADPLYYNLIARECWGDPHKGGYASGDNLYIPEETTVRNLAVIMHELSHNFDRGMGFNPPWFGEGKSFPIYVKFTEDTRREYRAFQSPFSKGDIQTGEAAFFALEHEGENLLQYWGTDKFPYWGRTPDGRDLTSLGYRAANWLCWELSEYLGDGWLRNYCTLLRKEMEEKTFFMPRDRIRANSVIVDLFTRSSGRDAAAFFRDKRFELVDIYDWDAITVDCGGGEETYLTDAGESREEAAPGGKCRAVTDGAFTYTFPVHPGRKSLTLEVTRSGYGTCRAWEERIFRGRPSRARETRTYKLDDPALWKDSRLKLTFASEKYGDRTARIARIVLR